MNLKRMFFFNALLCIVAGSLFSQPSWVPSNILPVTHVFSLDKLRLSYKENDKYGLMDPSGKKMTAPTQKMWKSLEEGVLYAYQDPSTEGWGLANVNGQSLSPPIYSRVDALSEGYARIQRKVLASNGSVQGYEYNLVDKAGKPVLSRFYKNLGNVTEGLVAFQIDSLFGYLNPLGQVVVKPAFHFAKEFNGGLAPVMNGTSQWGFTDKTGKVVIGFQFGDAENFEGHLARVGKKEVVSRSTGSRTYWGLIDRKGTLLTPLQYRTIHPAHEQGPRVASTYQDEYLVLGSQGQVLTTGTYSYLGTWTNDGLVKAEKDKKTGFLNTQGKEVIPFLYESAYNFSEGLSAVKKDEKWGFINPLGQVVIPFQFQEGHLFKNGWCPVSREGELCLINKQGVVVMTTGLPYSYASIVRTETHLLIRLEKTNLLLNAKGDFFKVLPYEDVTNFSEGLAPVRKSGKFGFIDTEGKEVISLQWAGVNAFAEGLAPVQTSSASQPYFIDKTGKWLFELPSGYQFIGPFSEGMAKVAGNGLGGYMNKSGAIAIPAKYPNLGSFKNGMAVVVNAQKKYGFVDKTGKEVVPLIYDEAGDFSNEGLAPVKQGTLWGFVDKTGKMVIAPQFEVVSGFNNGVCGVKKGGKVGYIDMQNKEIVPLMFEDGKPFLDDFAAVKQNGKWGFANLRGKGKLVIPALYENVGKFAENLVFVMQNGKVGAINRNGVTIVPFDYQDAGEFSGGIAYVKKNGKFGVVDYTGREIIPPVCDQIGNYQNGKIAVTLDMKGYVAKKLP